VGAAVLCRRELRDGSVPSVTVPVDADASAAIIDEHKVYSGEAQGRQILKLKLLFSIL